jgi:hypothetical protein
MSVARSDSFFASPDPSAHGTEVETEAAVHLDRLAAVAAAHEGDSAALLQLLRQLEKLHRAIQDGAFRASLPSDRGSLFRLLQDMEQSGGWPYIPRLQLRTFLDLLQSDPAPSSEGHSEGATSEPLTPRDLEDPQDHVPEAA